MAAAVTAGSLEGRARRACQVVHGRGTVAAAGPLGLVCEGQGLRSPVKGSGLRRGGRAAGGVCVSWNRSRVVTAVPRGHRCEPNRPERGTRKAPLSAVPKALPCGRRACAGCPVLTPRPWGQHMRHRGAPPVPSVLQSWAPLCVLPRTSWGKVSPTLSLADPNPGSRESAGLWSRACLRSRGCAEGLKAIVASLHVVFTTLRV